MAKETLPIDVGMIWRLQINHEFLNLFISYTVGDLKYEILAAITKHAYTTFFVQFYIYDMEMSVANAIWIYFLDLA